MGSRTVAACGSPGADDPDGRLKCRSWWEDRQGLEPTERPAAERVFGRHGLAEPQEADFRTGPVIKRGQDEFEFDAFADQRFAAGVDQGWTAIDGRQAGFDIAVVVEATAAIDLDGSRRRMLSEMRQGGINLNATA